jgi:hypothetical protein
VTGNGMLMALKSIELVFNPLAKFSRGELAWAQAQWKFARACDSDFTSCLRWVARLQRGFSLLSARPPLPFLTARSALQKVAIG